MIEFFRLKTIPEVLEITRRFMPLKVELIPLAKAYNRVLAESITALEDVPEFSRSTMDGYAVRAQDTFGASPGSPALLEVVGEVGMGEEPRVPLGPGQAQRLATGGMLPMDADAVVMLEYTQELADRTLEVYRTVAPLENVVQRGEDVPAGTTLLHTGVRLRPQDIGLLAALGVIEVKVYQKPRVAIIASGDEITSIDVPLQMGQMRDANSYALAGQVAAMGGEPQLLGIVPDRLELLIEKMAVGLAETDLVLLSGGSSVGTRDLAIAAIRSFPQAEVLVHGVAISPGKPTILARIGSQPIFGLPGHPVSAMVIMEVMVRPLLTCLAGESQVRKDWGRTIKAVLSRNLASTIGREDFIRVRLCPAGGNMWAEPVLGKSGLISTMVKADGWIRIPLNTEGLEKGEEVEVILF
ncbi:molybdopterin molybdotransferase MoeA [Desulfobacca acetoxidans]|uniref:Molybdopterin molybdenumtransferase n=1 Tax=Desulfobacca acetoxidans (strain ATCC 700848 / DSM 11109 / ASRB2) TaxID=880072 RepID=F2NIU4_DESAR|nr:gephyrin-like molybdotransferase Glp [Desulfobacca acetoxidans]AEB10638.1 molybdenum cofactor synthesis domain protein [Desulfobacca acetoxidans DSM 11109]HAY23312.1 molybdopterin molybdenumtransferase MoeA [Desulfobacterales bacterium]